ncbi:MAG: type I-E CRISPR-associated endonuclease Cas1 [Bryobacterales bacterium]|nr:type I-E CRISPR-associated endonuclease Cas1 [Bryobacterales bacterium]
MKDLHILPKVRDSWSFLYAERSRIDQDDKSIALWDEEGKTAVPCASLTLLMLGPGTSITHAAVRTLADNGCLVLWSGEEGVRMYGVGLGETRSSANLLRQAQLYANPESRLRVVRNMYELRFGERLSDALSLAEIRGREGLRVRAAYAAASRATGVEWKGRAYKRTDWSCADPVNRALSTANSCLYGVCHSAIVAAGYSPAIGFIHTGKMLSFVYDVADLYKTEISIPAAFHAVAGGTAQLESRVRRRCRDWFHEAHLLRRVVDDLDGLLSFEDSPGLEVPGSGAMEEDEALPGELWDPESGSAAGGVNYGDEG